MPDNQANKLDKENLYDENYFEKGVQTGVSGYQNYRWMPELTIRMAHHLITELGIQPHDKVLDYGCAKGFLVKGFRVLDVEAYGCDISEYALLESDAGIRQYLWHISDVDDPALFREDYEWCIAKDVFEHIPEDQLRVLVSRISENANNMFVAVPLAARDDAAEYVIPDYDKDVTHVIRKTLSWWSLLFKDHGWEVVSEGYTFKGCKENWTSTWENGNGFFTLRSSVPKIIS